MSAGAGNNRGPGSGSGSGSGTEDDSLPGIGIRRRDIGCCPHCGEIIEEVDPDEFTTPVSDDRGHNIHMSFRCPPLWGRQVAKIIKMHEYPYESKGDVIRHALYRHFHWLENTRHRVPGSLLVSIRIAREALEDSCRYQEMSRTLDALNERVQYFMGHGEIREAKRSIYRVKRELEAMGNEGEEDYWRSKFLGELEGRYSRILALKEDEDPLSQLAPSVPSSSVGPPPARRFDPSSVMNEDQEDQEEEGNRTVVPFFRGGGGGEQE